MAWDDIKSTLESRPDVPDDKKLTAAEWNAMTADQQDHSPRHEQGGSDELSVSGLAGVLADPQTPEQEAVEDIVAALTVGGTNVDVAYDDSAATLTISTPALADQEVRDLIDTVVVGGTQVSTTYDGTNLTVDIDAPTQAEFDTHSGRHEDGGADELDVSGLSGVLADAQTPQTEAVQDIVGALVTGAGNVTVTYDDVGNVLTVDTSALNTEEVEDAVGALVTAGNAITVNYDDGANTLSVGVDESALSFYDGTNLTADVDNQSVSTDEVDIGKLASALDAAGYDITGVGEIGADIADTNDVDTERIGVGDYHFAGSYDGADPDARLDNAISASSPGDRIFLERGTYSADRTITTRGTTFTGVDSSDNGTLASGTWTLDGGEITIEDMRDITVVVNGVALSHIRGIQAGNITVNNNGDMRCLLTGLKGCSVTFASGTDTNVVDSSVVTTVTDNGNNTVGEIA